MLCRTMNSKIVFFVILLVITALANKQCTESTTEDTCIGSKIFAVLTIKTERKCANACQARSTCESFNFHTKKGKCELSEYSSENVNLTAATGWKHSNIKDWPLAPMKSCGARNCKADELCDPIDNTTHYCIPLSIDCGSPPMIKNATAKMLNDTYYGSEVEYKCKLGMKYVSGKNISTCQLNFRWSGVDIQCTKIDCGQPHTIENTNATEPNNTYYGSQVDYNCSEGRIYISGKNISTCQLNSSWSDVNIQCPLIDCGKYNQTIAGANATVPNNTYLGSKVEHKCRRGMMYVSGTNSSTCQHNSLWSTVDLICKIQECGSPPHIDEYNVTAPTSITYNSTVNYVQKDGKKSAYIKYYCDIDGNWIVSNVSMTYCGSLFIENNTAVDLTNSTNMFNCQLIYRCNRGIINGTFNFTCNFKREEFGFNISDVSDTNNIQNFIAIGCKDEKVKIDDKYFCLKDCFDDDGDWNNTLSADDTCRAVPAGTTFVKGYYPEEDRRLLCNNDTHIDKLDLCHTLKELFLYAKDKKIR